MYDVYFYLNQANDTHRYDRCAVNLFELNHH